MIQKIKQNKTILQNYYENTNINKPGIITKMKGVADAIQLCDMDEFPDKLKELSYILPYFMR